MPRINRKDISLRFTLPALHLLLFCLLCLQERLGCGSFSSGRYEIDGL